MQADELPEVGVDGDQDLIFGSCTLEQRSIARVGTEIAGLENIVPPRAQPGREPSPGAPIDEEFHDPATVTADRVSLAMTAWA